MLLTVISVLCGFGCTYLVFSALLRYDMYLASVVFVVMCTLAKHPYPLVCFVSLLLTVTCTCGLDGSEGSVVLYVFQLLLLM